jgi:hypothetical protein
MFGDKELENLILFPEVLPMKCGWRIIKRASWVDTTPNRPHGLSYALILQNDKGERLLGFDNSHGFDGAQPNDPYDHEHKPNRLGQRFRYDFKAAGQLISDFMDRVGAYAASVGVRVEFSSDIQL